MLTMNVVSDALPETVPERLNIAGHSVLVERKAIKQVHLSVHPPVGAVRISAPQGLALDTVRVFAISKLRWIRRQQQRQTAQNRESVREYVERESHLVWGRRYLLSVSHSEQAASVSLSPRRLQLQCREHSTTMQRQAAIDAWLRAQLYEAIPPLLQKWQVILGVTPSVITVRQMKTKWGSCNPSKNRIVLNTELAKKPKACLEYVLVHELAHLLEPTHNERFKALLAQSLPNWHSVQESLNKLPIRHQTWL